MKTIPTCCFLPLLLLAPLVAQDSLQLKDGRFVFGKRMTASVDGVTVHFDNGNVKVPKELIRSCTARDASGNTTDLSTSDKDKMAKGLVMFKGRWVKAVVRDKQIARDRVASARRIEAAKKRRKWVNRHKMKTRNFEFEFTIDPELMRGYMDLMEVYYKVFTKEWRIRKPSKMGRLKVCFYHDRQYFEQVGGAPSGVIGYFRFVEPIELNFFYDRMDEGATVDVMFHEANHYLTHLIDPKFHYPAWVNESLAEYYGASSWDPKTKTMQTGGIQEGRLAVLQDAVGLNKIANRTGSVDDENWLGLEDMIRIKRFSAIHYAWGWSFVHYLLSTPKYKSKFKKYYIDLAKSKKIKKVLGFRAFRSVEPDEQIKWLKSYLGVKDLKVLEKEWHNYIRQMKAASANGYHWAGTFAMSRGMPIKAQRLFKVAIDMGSTNPMTWVGLGRAQHRKDKNAEAVASFDKAISMDPLAAMFYIYKARVLEEGGEAGKEEGKKLRKLAFEIEPDNDQIIMETVWEDGK
ncbi:MAG: hypothetical protein VX951_01695 [Planctomycetota bacterium]|nr:hypothetical protein [Planctomycetota bacterium]